MAYNKSCVDCSSLILTPIQRRLLDVTMYKIGMDGISGGQGRGRGGGVEWRKRVGLCDVWQDCKFSLEKSIAFLFMTVQQAAAVTS